MAVVELLEAAGYRRIPLSRNDTGHFQATGTLAGRPLTVLVDTGADSTLVSIDVARELGLALEPLKGAGGGAGGVNLDIFKVSGGDLQVGDVRPRAKALYAMDLSHVNAAFARQGASHIDAILGVDVFDAHSAVIDYGSNSLFLRDI